MTTEVFADWVKETTTTTGTGTITLAGAASADLMAFTDVLTDGDIVPYAIKSGDNREVGLGTYTATGTTLARTTVLATWVSGVYDDTAPVAITLAGTSDVYIDLNSFQAMSKTDTKFTNYLIKEGATLNGTATGNHVNLGAGTSITGTAAQAYDFCTIGGGNFNQAIGNYSTVSGGGGATALLGNEAIGAYATVGGGTDNVATGQSNVIAGGEGNDTAYVYATVCGGRNNQGSGNYGTVCGGNANSSGNASYAFVGGGTTNSASKGYSTIAGGDRNDITTQDGGFIGGGKLNTCASSFGVIAGGNGNDMSAGSYPVIGGGLSNYATGSYSTVPGGRGNRSQHTHSTAFGGASNTRANYDAVFGATDSDTEGVANNTIRLQATGGNILIDGSVSSPEADYAEMFEWYDGNPNNEDRVGRFVSLHEGKIVMGAGRADKSGVANYLASAFTSPNSPTTVPMLGIISANPSVLGDAAPNHWNGRHIKDKFKRVQKDSYTKYEWQETTITPTIYGDLPPITYDEVTGEPLPQAPAPILQDGRTDVETFTGYKSNQDGKEYSEYPQYTHKGILRPIPVDATLKEVVFIPQVEPTYDATIPYTSRRERKEWDPVGMLGKLIVESAEPITSDYVRSSQDGRALNGTIDNGWRVLRVIDNYTVEVLFHLK